MVSELGFGRFDQVLSLSINLWISFCKPLVFTSFWSDFVKDSCISLCVLNTPVANRPIRWCGSLFVSAREAHDRRRVRLQTMRARLLYGLFRCRTGALLPSHSGEQSSTEPAGLRRAQLERSRSTEASTQRAHTHRCCRTAWWWRCLRSRAAELGLICDERSLWHEPAHARWPPSHTCHTDNTCHTCEQKKHLGWLPSTKPTRWLQNW